MHLRFCSSGANLVWMLQIHPDTQPWPYREKKLFHIFLFFCCKFLLVDILKYRSEFFSCFVLLLNFFWMFEVIPESIHPKTDWLVTREIRSKIRVEMGSIFLFAGWTGVDIWARTRPLSIPKYKDECHISEVSCDLIILSSCDLLLIIAHMKKFSLSSLLLCNYDILYKSQILFPEYSKHNSIIIIYYFLTIILNFVFIF